MNDLLHNGLSFLNKQVIFKRERPACSSVPEKLPGLLLIILEFFAFTPIRLRKELNTVITQVQVNV